MKDVISVVCKSVSTEEAFSAVDTILGLGHGANSEVCV